MFDRRAAFRLPSRIKKTFLQLYRLAILAGIVLFVRQHADRVRADGDWPISVNEVQAFLPEATTLRATGDQRNSLEILDNQRNAIGFAMRSMPYSKEIVGYSGPSDVLMITDKDERMLGIAIRSSYDTPSHVEDVEIDRRFMKRWNERTLTEVAAITDLSDAGIYSVAGATRTSEAVAWSITERAQVGGSAGAATAGPKWQWDWRDTAMISFLLLGCLFAFQKGKRLQKWRPLFSIATILIFGLLLTDLVAQSLLIGWVESRVPWYSALGTILFVFAVFAIPWFTSQPVYCQFICPHGNLQRWLMKVIPAKRKPRLGEGTKWALSFLPPLLLMVVLLTSFWQLELDLASIEPFDAYALRAAGIGTILVAIVGLAASTIIPMAYCKYGCPTGWLLDFVRKRSGKDRFSLADGLGLALLGLAFLLSRLPLSAFAI